MDYSVVSLCLALLVAIISADQGNEVVQATNVEKREVSDSAHQALKRSAVLSPEEAENHDALLRDEEFANALANLDKRSTLFRFGKRSPMLEYGKRQGSILRYGKRQGSILRYGKRGGTLFRFGRSGMAYPRRPEEDIPLCSSPLTDQTMEDKRTLFRFGRSGFSLAEPLYAMENGVFCRIGKRLGRSGSPLMDQTMEDKRTLFRFGRSGLSLVDPPHHEEDASFMGIGKRSELDSLRDALAQDEQGYLENAAEKRVADDAFHWGRESEAKRAGKRLQRLFLLDSRE